MRTPSILFENLRGFPRLLHTNAWKITLFKDDRFISKPFLFFTHQSFHHLVVHNLDSERVVTSCIRNISQKCYTLWDMTPCSLHAFTLVYWLVSSTLKMEETSAAFQRTI
jgi:hypothetical protein